MSETSKLIAELKREHDPRRPGKFEGEDIATLYFHERAMQSDGNSLYFGGENVAIDLFEATPEERRLLKAPAKHTWFAVEYSDQGFVGGEWITKERAEELIAEDDEEMRDLDAEDEDSF